MIGKLFLETCNLLVEVVDLSVQFADHFTILTVLMNE
jgi:hypothetical protein